MNKWEICPQCGEKLTFTEVRSEHFNGSEREIRHEDIAWCEPCWENKQTNQWYFTAGEIYDTYQLDNDIKQMKEDQIE